MWFNDIELPDDLLRARDESNLVIFAGAGVSCGPPSSLPLFEGLVERIAENAATLRAPAESLDRFLGRLLRNGNMVHELARSILLNPKSRPNDLHDLLLRLFGKPEAIRLVTTNFDQHFTSARQARWNDAVREYYAPALPRGDSFRGVVYLHGAAFIDPRDCVLTDEDFGRAYLTEGWTTRFLKDMFDRYTVLFIGYSHSDLVMNYLARGLPPSASTRRFVLHPGENEDHWTHLGIKQVHYPAEGDDHSSLARLLESWVREVESGLADRYQRLATLAAAHPAMLRKDDADFVRRSLSQEDAVQRFLHAAHDPAWVVWLEEKGLIDQLMHTEGQVERVQEEIARWLATKFLDDEGGTLLGLVERHHQNIHPCLWFHIHCRLQFDKEPIESSWFRRWVGILLFESPEASKNRVSDLVWAAAKRRDIESLLLLMDRLLTPKIRLQRSYFLSEGQLQPTTVTTLNLLTDHEDHWLREAWEQILRPALPMLVQKIELITHRALSLADRLLRSPELRPAYDPLWYARQDIETRDSPYSDAFDFVIEVCVEVIRFRMHAPKQNVVAYFDDLFGTSVPVLQRLAVAGIRISSNLSSDEKLQWLLSKRVLHSFWFRTETTKLLKAEIASCSEAVKSVILEAVARGPETDQREGLSSKDVDAGIFFLLGCLKDADESWKELDTPLAKLEELYPDFQTLPSSEQPASLGAQWGDSGEGFDLDAVLAEPSTNFLDGWLVARDYDLPGKPERWSYGAILPTLAKRSLSWVLSLGRAALDRNATLGDLWSSLAQAIHEAPRTDDDWRDILSLLRSAAGFDAGRDFAIRTLDHGIHAERDALPETLFEQADTLANELTQKLVQSATHLELGDDWVHAAINHPAGWLWRYWIGRGLKWRNSQTGERSLPQLLARNLQIFLEENWAGAEAARILCGQQIHILDYMDSNFARSVGLPLFSWSRNQAIALQTWSGFLAGGQWSVALKDFILEDFIVTIQRHESLPKVSRRELGRHLATVAVLALRDPLEEGILPRCIKPLPEDVLESFAKMIAHILREMKQDAAQAVWHRWLLKYLKDRSFGQPKPWTACEIQQIPLWVMHAGSLLPQAVAALKDLPHREGIQVDFVLHEIGEHTEIFELPNACAELILAVTDISSNQLGDAARLSDIIARIKSAGVSQELAKALDERMLRLGIT